MKTLEKMMLKCYSPNHIVVIHHGVHNVCRLNHLPEMKRLLLSPTRRISHVTPRIEPFFRSGALVFHHGVQTACRLIHLPEMKRSDFVFETKLDLIGML